MTAVDGEAAGVDLRRCTAPTRWAVLAAVVVAIELVAIILWDVEAFGSAADPWWWPEDPGPAVARALLLGVPDLLNVVLIWVALGLSVLGVGAMVWLARQAAAARAASSGIDNGANAPGHGLRAAVLFLGPVCFAPVLCAALSELACGSAGTDLGVVLASDRSLACWEGAHVGYLAAAAWVIFVYYPVVSYLTPRLALLAVSGEFRPSPIWAAALLHTAFVSCCFAVFAPLTLVSPLVRGVVLCCLWACFNGAALAVRAAGGRSGTILARGLALMPLWAAAVVVFAAGTHGAASEVDATPSVLLYVGLAVCGCLIAAAIYCGGHHPDRRGLAVVTDADRDAARGSVVRSYAAAIKAASYGGGDGGDGTRSGGGVVPSVASHRLSSVRAGRQVDDSPSSASSSAGGSSCSRDAYLAPVTPRAIRLAVLDGSQYGGQSSEDGRTASSDASTTSGVDDLSTTSDGCKSPASAVATVDSLRNRLDGILGQSMADTSAEAIAEHHRALASLVYDCQLARADAIARHDAPTADALAAVAREAVALQDAHTLESAHAIVESLVETIGEARNAVELGEVCYRDDLILTMTRGRLVRACDGRGANPFSLTPPWATSVQAAREVVAVVEASRAQIEARPRMLSGRRFPQSVLDLEDLLRYVRAALAQMGRLSFTADGEAGRAWDGLHAAEAHIQEQLGREDADLYVDHL